MKPFFERGLGLFYLGLLRGASLLVPGSQRAEWRREWDSELWHVRHSWAPADGVSWRAEREVTAFCLGAFQDAFCLRRHSAQADRFFTAPQGSAAHCMLVLGAMLAACYTMALLLHGVCAEHFLSKYQAEPGGPQAKVLRWPGVLSNHARGCLDSAAYPDWMGSCRREFKPFFAARIAWTV